MSIFGIFMMQAGTSPDSSLRVLWLAVRPFIWHPERAWAVGGIFLIMYFASRRLEARGVRARAWIALVPALAWGLFGVLELSSKLERSDIRIDLLVTWPALVVITVLGTAAWSLDYYVTKRRATMHD